jgi:selenocysteine lyase/cysteine desulfurase
VSTWADRFASFDGVAWLDAASRGPMPIAALRSVREALAFLERPQRLGAGHEAAHAAEARALAARLFTTREETVSVVRSAAAAVALFVEALDLAPGDEVFVPWGDEAARADLWRAVARRGARLVEVAPADGAAAVSAERLAGAVAVSRRPRLVAFSHVSALHGGRVDPPLVLAAAREAGARVLVDGSLAAGALPFDLGACGVDLYVAAAERHLLGPPGAALAILSSAGLALMGAGGDEVRSGLRGAAGALPGLEPPSLPALLALTESLRLLVEATPAGVQARARGLCDRVLARLPPGFSPASPLEPAQRSHVVCFTAWDRRATAEAHRRLLAARIQAALLDDRIRVSPHLYNSDADVERLLAALASE